MIPGKMFLRGWEKEKKAETGQNMTGPIQLPAHSGIGQQNLTRERMLHHQGNHQVHSTFHTLRIAQPQLSQIMIATWGVECKLLFLRCHLGRNMQEDRNLRQGMAGKTILLFQSTQEISLTQPHLFTIPSQEWDPHPIPLWCIQSVWSQCILGMLHGLHHIQVMVDMVSIATASMMGDLWDLVIKCRDQKQLWYFKNTPEAGKSERVQGLCSGDTCVITSIPENL